MVENPLIEEFTLIPQKAYFFFRSPNIPTAPNNKAAVVAGSGTWVGCSVGVGTGVGIGVGMGVGVGFGLGVGDSMQSRTDCSNPP
jgi:hypothetical protein